ncbi:glycosyltransferase family 4 protein [Marinomonas shanghaiensis]|uniref:glycosyltransferase family 4 protein n=1 Tax=Marinomonas shanghaiensis TaxID=2202418 RepID=UPI0013002602|nr:glycosyltransferase family 4 protein [Marinomonas shanghaiensis]
MKVSQVLYSGFGGHGSVAWGVYHGLKSKGYDLEMLFFGIEPVATSYKELCCKNNVSYKYIRSIRRLSFLSWFNVFFRLLLSKPDVVILHSVVTLLPCLIYAKLLGKKIIFVEHQANKLKNKKNFIISRLGMRFSDKVVYLTEGYKKEMLLYLKKSFKSEKVAVISNGIDECFYTSKNQPALSLDNNVIHIGMAARFNEMRHQSFLLDVIKLLSEKNLVAKWHLSLAGDGPTLKEVRDKVVELKLDNQVTLNGYLDEQSLVKWFNDLDIYVHATAGETLSTSMLQAMSCYLPIVASDVDGVASLMSYRPKFGECVSPLDVNEFSEAIEKIALDKSLRYEYSKNSRLVVVDNFSMDAMSKRYDDLIKSLD